MRVVLICFVTLTIVLFTINHNTNAGCNPPVGDVITCTPAAPNPDFMGVQQSGNNNDLTVNVLEGTEINTEDDELLDAIRTSGGNDLINVTRAIVRGGDSGIETGGANDTINVIGALVSADFRGIEAGNQDDTVNIMEGADIISTGEIAIQTGNDMDKVTVDDSTVTSFVNDGIETANAEDMVTITNSVITGGPGFFAVDLGNGDDMLTLNNGADLRGGIDCRDDFDILVFAMQVPTDELDELTAQIEASDPEGGSITINRLFYEWENCEELVADLSGGFISPVPTLSEWGLIAMAGLLGIVGFIMVRRKRRVIV
ncbi:MAG: IPTL-CTERM sorting domain-containing protein [Thermodesulfobacteriota bacterium]